MLQKEWMKDTTEGPVMRVVRVVSRERVMYRLAGCVGISAVSSTGSHAHGSTACAMVNVDRPSSCKIKFVSSQNTCFISSKPYQNAYHTNHVRYRYRTSKLARNLFDVTISRPIPFSRVRKPSSVFCIFRRRVVTCISILRFLLLPQRFRLRRLW
jgi:hypothetical protein